MPTPPILCTMSYADSDFVFINNTTETIDPDSGKFKKKAIKVRAARHLPPQKDQCPPTPFKSASKWNRYQARTRVRQKARLNTFSLDAFTLEHSQERRDGLDNDPDPTDEQSGHPTPKIGGTSLLKFETSSSTDKAMNLVPSMQGAGWVAPFVPLENLTRAYFPLLLEHCRLNPQISPSHLFVKVSFSRYPTHLAIQISPT